MMSAGTSVKNTLPVELHCKELEGKPIGFVLQKVLYTKNDGGDGYRFEIRQAFGANTRKTYKEAIDGTPAEAVDKLVASLTDRDERLPSTPGLGGHNTTQQRSMLGGQQQTQSRLQQSSGGRGNQPAPQNQDWDDGIPF